MHPFEIFFHNNGDATFQTDDFCHVYPDMAGLAMDFSLYQASGSTDDWDGNEPQYRHSYDPEMERNGTYWCLNDETWATDAKPGSGYNVQKFLSRIVFLDPIQCSNLQTFFSKPKFLD